MKVIADFCIIPLGVGISLSPYIAECVAILEAHGLKTQLHAYGTNVEGEWAAVFAALEACHHKIHQMGAPRVSTTVKLGTRTDRAQSMEDKVSSVVEKMA